MIAAEIFEALFGLGWRSEDLSFCEPGWARFALGLRPLLFLAVDFRN